ncbi:MAG: glycerol-3-phosphate 1-O-acyltransferase PlsB [Gammaproteobacteria bacterium]|jgi:glycerol-3-phosphate O-acyltransferase|nr:glycerol-3-phosphate 1-O-acyltransferase PlsB [Gammaproteobacteria bacterium]MBT4380137.1 glycerol-3-phosphate 1-O-acyltransferase PlsB [Gammaproteobacteria bacterium]MBT5199964.1 glycerol-3-phosphate 1-O-acyltransferase PlsB [Gammaproteobacteria bacterium]MBT5444575.1 glycerol-3-phosphate 1-O-acyltransferase PlsB [Gammaproteobacteria bacterium]MBT5790084.1 glycerol-3-phosphate 1-O-acyltransferase PlsB [Gammaproteobacteria bacterium]
MEISPKLSALRLKLKTAQFELSRRVLFLWIKPIFLGGSHESLDLGDSDLICYVLPFRSIADLLVTDMACEVSGLPSAVSIIPEINEGRAVFFLGRPEGTLGRKSLRQQSARMMRLFEHQKTLDNRSIKIVPVSLFWGHQPDREKSLFKLLLSEHWSATSGLKKFFAMLFHPGHILVQFGAPVALDELMSSESEQPRQVRKLLRLLRVNFNNQRQAIIGPDLSHRRTLLNNILASDEVRGAIDREARTNDVTFLSVEKKAMAYAQEIASDQSYRVIRFFDVLLTRLWNKLYSGIEVNHIDTVKQMAQSHEIVYTPCHRSHIDYLLMSYVLYNNGLAPPHIAAGKNLNLPFIGPLLRRAGAFFMRRSFQGDGLYREVFDEYLHQVFTRGFSVEYFIEGGRSRTGRTLPPRTGMLRMTVNSFHKDSSKPIVFMPVYFGYERVLESSTYMAELSGKDKQSESVFDILGIFRSLKRQFGQVTVNFGEPLPLQEFMDKQLPGWQQLTEIPPVQLSKTCLRLAENLVTRINESVAVKPTNLVAVALLSTARQNIDEQYLLDQIELLLAIARKCGPSRCSITNATSKEILEQAIEICGLSRTEHPFGTIVSASPEQSISLTYNANNVVHVYALPSLVARFVRTETRTDRNALAEFVKPLYPFLKSEMFLPWDILHLEEVLDSVVESLSELGLITMNGNEIAIPSPESPEYNSLQDIASITDPTLERFYIVMALLQQSNRPSLKALESASAGIAEQLSVIYGINSPEFFDKSLFSTFLRQLKSEQVVDTELAVNESFAPLESATARSLDADVRYNILQAVRKFNN